MCYKYPERRWAANWIEYNPNPSSTSLRKGIDDAAPIFFKLFTLENKPDNAKIYISGLGFYLLKINDQRVSDELLSPEFTSYDKKAFYNVYDISDFLKKGQNKIEVTLGNGWFLEHLHNGWGFEHASWKARNQLICEIIADEQLILKTDSSWLCGKSKIVFNSLRAGETYDNTFEDVEYISAYIAHGPGGILTEQIGIPIRLKEVIEPISVLDNIYDYGLNLTGNVEISVKGKRGDKITIQYGERIDGNNIVTSGYLPATNYPRFQTDEYILSGDGIEKWHSEFGYNGFRYAKITGDVEVISAKARFFHTDLEPNGHFECDNEFFNKLQNAVNRSTLCNFHHMPTDCPHREKNGWTGDSNLSSEQAIFNHDMKDAYIKWLDDIVDCQRPNGAIPCIAPTSVWGYNWGTGNAWDIVLFELPWNLYCYYGDKSVLSRYFCSMKKYINFLDTMHEENVWINGLGDWCAPNGCKTVSLPAILTGYAYRMVTLFAKIAKVLELFDESKLADDWAKKIRKTFIEKFEDNEPDTQAMLAMQLYFGLTDKSQEIFERLVKVIEKENYHIKCGISGIKWLFVTLTKYGRHDIACRILETEDYPSYKYMVNNGSGTLWEQWDTSSVWAASQNHHMYSSIGDWFYKCVAGINVDENNVGFKNIIITPHLSDTYNEFSAWHITPYGKLAVEYKDSIFNITIPEGCTADFKFRNIERKLYKSEIINIQD